MIPSFYKVKNVYPAYRIMKHKQFVVLFTGHHNFYGSTIASVIAQFEKWATIKKDIQNEETNAESWTYSSDSAVD